MGGNALFDAVERLIRKYDNRWTSETKFDTQLLRTKEFTELRSLKVQICKDLGLTVEITYGFGPGSSDIKMYLWNII